MGEHADDAIDRILDWDEIVEGRYEGDGYYDHLNQIEDGEPKMFPFSGVGSKYHKPSGPGPCPRCGDKTKKRKGPYGVFYGCINFPRCKGNRDG